VNAAGGQRRGDRLRQRLASRRKDVFLIRRAQHVHLAVLRVAGLTLTPAPLGSADTLRPGDSVVAIGSPLGLSGSVSVGVVSALHRDITFNRSQQGLSQQPSESLQDAIQTDAAINPGNSGGPLIDALGEVIGVNSSIYTPSGGSVGLGFAIPIFTTEQTKDVAKVGDLKLQTTESTSHVIPPFLSGGALVLGVVLIGAGFYRKR